MENGVSRLEVLRYELEVELSKRNSTSFPSFEESNFKNLLELLPTLHDAPRNSHAHLYAALADNNLVWQKTEIPVSRIIIGPGDTKLHSDVVAEAEGFLARFVQLVKTKYCDCIDFKSYFWNAVIKYPVVPCVLIDYKDQTPWVPEPKKDYGLVYRLQDGYHRVFQMIFRGEPMIKSFVASYKDGSPWEGYFEHLLRFENGRWIPKYD